MLLQSPKSLAVHLESYHLHRHFTSQLDNLDNIQVDPLEVDWITKWGGGGGGDDSRTSILKAIKRKL